MHTYHLTIKSANKKTGPIPVSSTSEDSCPESCPLKGGGCYGKYGHLRIHWDKVSGGDRGTSLEQFCDKIRSLPDGQLWRHNQVGDLPKSKIDGDIDHFALCKIVRANKGKRGFTYTHHSPHSVSNMLVVRMANSNGFTINWSADNLKQARRLRDLHIGPIVTLLPEHATPDTVPHDVIVCPATYLPDVTCATCGLCAIASRKKIVGFPVHGAGKGKADEARKT